MEPKQKTRFYRNIFQTILILITCAIFFSLGFLVARDGEVGSIKGNLYNITKGKSEKIDFSLFWEAWDSVEKNYVGKLDEKKMVDGAIGGMVNSLDDPYTTYLPADINDQFREDISGHFDGIGIEVTSKDGMITIVSPLESSPAQKAGLKAQDIIVEINNKSTAEMSVEQAVKMMRGKSGTDLTLKVIREGTQDPLGFKITRSIITVKSVKWDVKEGNIGYIKVSQFGEDTFGLFKQAINDLSQKKASGIIIDLRNNPGGLLDTAVDMTSLMVKSGVVVQRKYKDGHIEKDRTSQKSILLNTELVVLVNGGSASASEIFAGAIQDYKRGIIIGEKTFGKGSVQDLIPLPDGSSVKVTIAKWLTPMGRPIDGMGVEPDIKVTDSETGADPVLAKALEQFK
ncbi:MAG: S41 family peptidase [bacterium]|nr:S41 family peptidase [bacterium]